ncbi:major facilitator superfamily domain-containing protein [Cadophora sp. MPI-SDFR-AT-0126]|nr:major facilitator superfamily domain-containing protein [Leotiomycetes sp. MPI-SDFR-AT-0126]
MDTPNSESGRGSLKPGEPPAVHCESVIDPIGFGELGPPQYDAAATRRLLRKLDFRLLPFFALLYLLSFLDRTNIGNARLFGLIPNLGMDPKSLQFNTALAVFFPTYILAEIPSNMMMKRLTPSIWLSFIMVVWSAIVIGMGFVHNFSGLIACRVLLGLAEGGLFPGVAYYITLWYPRHETGFRIAFFFSAATAAGAFGGLLAAAIGKMAGLGGKAGWSWIFIIEGLLTIVVGVIAYFVIVDSPEKAKFVTEEDKVEIRRRIAHDADELADDFDMRYVWDALKDWKIWAHCLCTIGIFTPVYSFSFFLPTIIRNMGYSNTRAQLMSAPPYVVGCLVTISAGYFADKKKQRGLFQAAFSGVALMGWIMLISSHRPAVQYTGTFFACSGIFACVPLGVAWDSNNIGGSLKRGVGIAMHVGSGNLGGILASYIYLPKDSPRFIQGHAILVALISMSLCLSLGIRFWLKAENARRDSWAVEHNMRPEDMTREQKFAERHKGDNASFFRYTL